MESRERDGVYRVLVINMTGHDIDEEKLADIARRASDAVEDARGMMIGRELGGDEMPCDGQPARGAANADRLGRARSILLEGMEIMLDDMKKKPTQVKLTALATAAKTLLDIEETFPEQER